MTTAWPGDGDFQQWAYRVAEWRLEASLRMDVAALRLMLPAWMSECQVAGVPQSEADAPGRAIAAAERIFEDVDDDELWSELETAVGRCSAATEAAQGRALGGELFMIAVEMLPLVNAEDEDSRASPALYVATALGEDPVRVAVKEALIPWLLGPLRSPRELSEGLAAGSLSTDRVELAAWLGDEAARRVWTQRRSGPS